MGKRKYKVKKDKVESSLENVPTINFLDNEFATKVQQLYEKYYVVLIQGYTNPLAETFDFNYLSDLYKDYNDDIEQSWSIENSQNHLTCKDVFQNAKTLSRKNWYISTILQHNDSLVQKFLKDCPCINPFPPSCNIKYTQPIWIFCGKCNLKSSFDGRKEHTDSISHSGTWHYQCSGKKIWHIRPAEESEEWNKLAPKILKKTKKYKLDESIDKDGYLSACCNTGDILMINTKLWWHSTKLVNDGEISYSYARDFYLNSDISEDEIKLSSMTNVDGLYASKNFKKGDIVLSERDLPNCSLSRSIDANCTVSTLDNDELVLEAVKDIHVGDWLTVFPSSDEESDDEGSEFSEWTEEE